MEFSLNGRELRYENDEFYIKAEKTHRGYKEGEWRKLSVINHSDGYKIVRIDDKMYKLHRVIAYLFLGLDIENKNKQIDHINGNRSDNRLENLRIVNNQQNHFNQTKAKGYSKRGNKFIAYIKINGKSIHLGCFNTEEEAHNAYLEAKEIYHKIC